MKRREQPFMPFVQDGITDSFNYMSLKAFLSQNKKGGGSNNTGSFGKIVPLGKSTEYIQYLCIDAINGDYYVAKSLKPYNIDDIVVKVPLQGTVDIQEMKMIPMIARIFADNIAKYTQLLEPKTFTRLSSCTFKGCILQNIEEPVSKQHQNIIIPIAVITTTQILPMFKKCEPMTQELRMRLQEKKTDLIEFIDRLHDNNLAYNDMKISNLVRRQVKTNTGPQDEFVFCDYGSIKEIYSITKDQCNLGDLGISLPSPWICMSNDEWSEKYMMDLYDIDIEDNVGKRYFYKHMKKFTGLDITTIITIWMNWEEEQQKSNVSVKHIMTSNDFFGLGLMLKDPGYYTMPRFTKKVK